MVYTTACESCRKVRMKCIRPSRGMDQSETCERCEQNHAECITIKRRVGRQPGVKNRKRKGEVLSEHHQSKYQIVHQEHTIPRDVIDHLPNPLHVLASEAVRRQSSPETSDDQISHASTSTRTSKTIVDQYSEWADKLHPNAGAGREAIMIHLDKLLSMGPRPHAVDAEEPSVFVGRTDMARPDASPENDVISLRIISLADAQHLFDKFMTLIINGSKYFDPRIHTLSYVRSRSSFLLAVILAIASTYKPLCPSSILHSHLMSHALKLETTVRNNHLKSIEIIQALLLLASWTEVPCTLSRDKTWMFVSHAIALAVELRLDSPLPHCVQTDPMFDKNNQDLLVRNAHRVCLLMFIHDRNMAMVAGRHPIIRDTSLVSTESLSKWGKHALAHKFDAPICASVSLRKLVTVAHVKLTTHNFADFAAGKEFIDRGMADWRKRWAVESTSTHEYDIIARFSAFVLALALVKKRQATGHIESEARKVCEALAFDVCCGAINHYKTWQGLPNSATFDTSMVAFCAIYTLQSIHLTASPFLSDWSLLRLATLQELLSCLETQADERHGVDTEGSLSVVEQVARGIRNLLGKKQIWRGGSRGSFRESEDGEYYGLSQAHNLQPDPYATSNNHTHNQSTNAPSWPTNSTMDDLTHFLYAATDGSLPFMADWDFEGLLPSYGSNTANASHSGGAGRDMSTFGVETSFTGSDPGSVAEMSQGVNMQNMFNMGCK
ncbi:transcription factor [Cryptococcus wingfieldii CBS 7118]|uniref:Transcription factor n=1 Tax=Cryptococcus wingfieldii CBS 7118 TaxID=1295528 RepID=A0A1E3IAM3_9TREE|nr:transcription factor [Cryptococcus wingfieldii CBS 7118]ODN85654.1 transcription factor [Cryptococcus wingfieldii CBS 7118]